MLPKNAKHKLCPEGVVNLQRLLQNTDTRDSFHHNYIYSKLQKINDYFLICLREAFAVHVLVNDWLRVCCYQHWPIRIQSLFCGMFYKTINFFFLDF